jgi:hypothetical protein
MVLSVDTSTLEKLRSRLGRTAEQLPSVCEQGPTAQGLCSVTADAFDPLSSDLKEAKAILESLKTTP